MIVYTRGTTDTEGSDQAQMRDSAAEMCARRGWEAVAFVREQPGETHGLEDALRMVRGGEADRVVMGSGVELPDVIESDTGGLTRQWISDVIAGPTGTRRLARHRRTRPTRRGDEGA